MPRYLRARVRSEEEKRNLKVDPKRIPEWEAELESIRSHFKRFDLAKVASAATLIQEVRKHLRLYHFGSEYESEKTQLEEWIKWLSVDSLVELSTTYSTPKFVRYGMEENVVELIRSRLGIAEGLLAQNRAKGATNSYWESVFTGKVDENYLRRLDEEYRVHLSYSHKIPLIVDALRLLNEVRLAARECESRVSEIRRLIRLATEKKDAISRFEKKHGKAFAKAAALDSKSRSRAASLKLLVKKTSHCPYCGGSLGADPHLDHIYPVAKGGLSIVENLVWCCSACNAAKTDKGLMQFLKERGLSIERALSQLHALEKHV